MPGGRFRRAVFLGSWVISGILLAHPSGWGEPQIEVNRQPSRAVKVGEVCKVTIQVSWKTGEGDYRFLKPELPLENLERVEEGETSEVFHREGEEWKRKSFRFKLRSRQIGSAAILPFQIYYVDPATQGGGQFQVERWNLRVVPDRSKLYRGIVGASAAVAMGILLGTFYRRGRLKKHLSSSPLEDSLEDQYLKQLEELTRREAGSFSSKEQVFETNRLLRAYLGEKLALPASIQTGQEILGHLQDKLSGDDRKALKEVFDKLENWCYAGPVGSPREWEELKEKIRHYLVGKKVVEGKE